MAKKDEAEVKGQKDAEAPKETKGAGDSKASDSKKAEASAPSSNKIAAFFQGTREELGKVVWPSRQQLISESLAVILMVTLSAALIYFVDNFFSWAATQVFG
ncbi:MAG TPA: preprotein translocase subunit SecE [Coleofasciculaceae cyanobacterium]